MIFAYGSLVNPAARPQGIEAIPALLSGWRREWSHRVVLEASRVCALSVAPDTQCDIEGVVLPLADAHIVEMDEREIGYNRVSVTARTLYGTEAQVRCEVYVGVPAKRGPATQEYPIWRSYLDCVLDGYLRLGGREAVERFVTSTGGWPAPILDDGASPKYPRAVHLTAAERDIVDSILGGHGLLRDMFC